MKELKDREKAFELLQDLLKTIRVAAVTEDCIREALKLKWRDFEDSVQYAVGKSIAVDCIITRNPKDFSGSKLRVLTPSEFLLYISAEDGNSYLE